MVCAGRFISSLLYLSLQLLPTYLYGGGQITIMDHLANDDFGVFFLTMDG